MRKNATIDLSLFKKDFVAEAKQKIKEMTNNKCSPYELINRCDEILSDMPIFMAHTIDFTIFHPESVMRFAKRAA